METECPNCKHVYNVEGRAIVPESQRLTLTLGYESEFISAAALGKAITAMAGIQESVAGNMGITVTTFVHSIEMKPKELAVIFQIIRSEKDAPAK